MKLRFPIILLAGLLMLFPAANAAAQSAADLPIYGYNPSDISAAIEQAQQAQEALKEAKALTASKTKDTPETTQVEQPLPEDYAKNKQSNMFGAQLFTGAFANQAAVSFNADYAITIGDTVNVRLWGGYTYQSALTVDPQGNIFVPNVGPVHLLGVRNAQLQATIDQAVRGIFKSNVFAYASLASAQPVRVYVGGFVNRPGAYAGTSMDSVLHYLDQAGGVDPDRGSYLDIEVKRGTQVRARINLYRFLLAGEMPQVQLADGDVIFVNPRQHTVAVSGLAENPRIFEFAGDDLSLAELGDYAKPLPDATNVRVTRSAGTILNVEYYSLDQAASVYIHDGDQVAYTADKRPGTITVRVEGEHDSPQEFVLPYGSRLGDVLKQLTFTDRSAANNIQLFRKSVKVRQKKALDTTLRALEAAALTARSGTSDEARLRTDEANLLLKFVDRASKLEPTGQVTLAKAPDKSDILLENGDVIHVPTRDGLVLVSGEVLFPNAVAYDPGLRIDDYVKGAGGYSKKANSTQIVVAHQDGSYARARGRDRGLVKAGDQIMVLPAVDSKGRQVFKDLTQILYQIAVTTHIVLGL